MRWGVGTTELKRVKDFSVSCNRFVICYNDSNDSLTVLLNSCLSTPYKDFIFFGSRDIVEWQKMNPTIFSYRVDPALF